jgi:hypothetical protein
MGGFDVIFMSPSSLRFMDFLIKKIGFNVLITTENCGKTPLSKEVKELVYLKGYLQVVTC